MKLLTTALLLISDITIANDSLRQSQCKLEHKRITLSMKKRGDVILGGIMQMSTEISVIADGFYNMRKRPNEQICTIQSLHYLRHFLAFLYAVEEINKETDFLPNITLGFEIYDTCMAERKAVEVVLYMLTGQNAIVPNYRCNIERKVTAFIGHRMPSSTYSVAALLGLYRYPQITYGAMDHSINSRILYPSLFHTVPNEQIQFKAIILLLQHFGWNWVGIITSDNDHYLRSSLELQDAITKSGGCVEVLIPVSHAAGDKNITNITSSRVVETLTRSSCTVFIINSDESGFLSMLLALSKQFQIRKVFILPPHLPNVDINAYNYIFNGSLGVTVHKGNIPGLKEFLQRDHSELYNKSVLFRFVYFITIISFFPNDSWSQYKSYFSKLDPFVYDVYNFRITHRVYTAVYAVAHALHDMYLHRNHKLSSTGKPMDWQPWQINQYLRKVHFITPGGEEVNLDDKESALTKFDVINYHVLPNKSLRTMEVGHIYLNRSQNLQIKINDSKIKWGPAFTQIPRSVCTESCSPGFRKAPGKVRHKCCYECVPCSEGEISNSSDMENCLTCPEDQWPDIDRVLCIPRSIEFLSYQDPLGAAVTALAVSFSALTVTVLGIFINHRHTPIVKANNENLSYLLLISLMLCFLCSLLFIGRPVKITCLLRQAAFGIIFTVAISCVLSKTITVVIAFNALKPNSKLRKWLGNRIPACLVLLCTLGVGLICIVWWILSPPFPDTDTHTEQGKIILKCNEGSVTIFYTMVGYIGFLAILSFVVAFLARKLPDTFNEAQYITFSMLVFCSVWVSFIPAYLSTKGKYMVAMEVFAILASGAGLICCIFIPKCYIILIRPDLNTRTHVSK